jgi:hypothetical protein
MCHLIHTHFKCPSLIILFHWLNSYPSSTNITCIHLRGVRPQFTLTHHRPLVDIHLCEFCANSITVRNKLIQCLYLRGVSDNKSYSLDISIRGLLGKKRSIPANVLCVLICDLWSLGYFQYTDFKIYRVFYAKSLIWNYAVRHMSC